MSWTSTPVTTRRAHHISTTVNHTNLKRWDTESIKWFLNLYYQYLDELKARAGQLGDVIMTEAAKPVDIKYYDDIYIIKSTIYLCLIYDAYDAYDDLYHD